MRKRKKLYITERQYWRRYWRYRMFGEVLFPTIVLAPEDLHISEV